MLRIGGQLRVSDGRAIGYDFASAFALGAALGVCPVALAEFLPAVERSVVSTINENAPGAGDDEEV